MAVAPSRTLRVAGREVKSAARSPIRYASRLIQVRFPGTVGYSQEAQKRIFSLDLHTAGTASVRGGLEQLGVNLVQWMIGDPKHIARDRPSFPVADPVAHVNRHSWTDLNDKRISEFWQRYGNYLAQFDGFLVNHASALARLFLPAGKPILVHNTSRYECPYTTNAKLWASLNEDLIAGVERGQIYCVSNNQADADYLRFYTGLDSCLMPSVTDYAHGTWTNERPEIALSALSKQDQQVVQREIGPQVSPLHELFARGYSFAELFSLRGIVVIPYQVSTMFMFEVMNAGMPMYVPSDSLMQEWVSRNSAGVLSQLSYFQVRGIDTNMRPRGDLNRTCDSEIRQWWLDRADFSSSSGYPLIRRFDSFDHLGELVQENIKVEDSVKATKWADKNRARRAKILSDFVSLM